MSGMVWHCRDCSEWSTMAVNGLCHLQCGSCGSSYYQSTGERVSDTACARCGDEERTLQEHDGEELCAPCIAEQSWHDEHQDGECEDGRSLDHDYECGRDHRAEHAEARAEWALSIATCR